MYNRYIPPDTAYAPIPQEEEPSQQARQERAPDRPTHHQQPQQKQAPPGPQAGSSHGSDLLDNVVSGVSDLLGGLFKNFSLENLDTGDILLILIILFLFLEGDNLDLVIALGLMLLLGLGEDDQPSA